MTKIWAFIEKTASPRDFKVVTLFLAHHVCLHFIFYASITIIHTQGSHHAPARQHARHGHFPRASPAAGTAMKLAHNNKRGAAAAAAANVPQTARSRRSRLCAVFWQVAEPGHAALIRTSLTGVFAWSARICVIACVNHYAPLSRGEARPRRGVSQSISGETTGKHAGNWDTDDQPGLDGGGLHSSAIG